NMYDWIDSNKLYHLSLYDVQLLEIGTTIDVAIFDSNFEEYGIWSKTNAGDPYKPIELFKYNRHKIEIIGGECEGKCERKWLIHFNWGESYEHPYHYNIENLATNWKWISDKSDLINI